ncbi:MAG: nickel pincer cofactor biosynthesis protein LarB [Candidatus Sumerlaeaceae bacterium]|nr:nickel pincer cofactor biosynthesis protein LarB [Candidatus Sumerlaeaceae bacterium]
MDERGFVRTLLQKVASGEITPRNAERELLSQFVTGYAELMHTKLDLHRRYRRGVPEAIYGANKTAQQLLDAVKRMDAAGQTVLCTRVDSDKAEFVMRHHGGLSYHEGARLLYKLKEKPRRHGLIAVISAGTSDQPVAEEAALCAELMGNRVHRVYDVGVAGLHRLLHAASQTLLRARVIIVVAGMEGALPSVVAGLVSVPVVAVPTSVGYGANFGGVAALLGMLNSCSGGVSVVNIDNGFGAALVAHLINQPPRLRAKKER